MLKLILLLTFGLIYLSEGYVLTKTFDQPANRIVGGENATEGAIPYQVSLRSILNSHFCGGSIIADRWVLTAAHCTSGQWKYFIMVVVGTNRLSSGGDRYAVNQIIVHENYDKEVIKNDISVVKVSRPFVYKDSVQPIQIPYEDTAGGANLILTGWGRLSYPGDLPDQLQIISLTALSVEDCEEIYNGNSTDTPAVNGTQICSFTKAGEGACHGDSGGPLVEGDRVVGVVSWGVPCAQGYPDVYTRVYAYRTWILDHINAS